MRELFKAFASLKSVTISLPIPVDITPTGVTVEDSVMEVPRKLVSKRSSTETRFDFIIPSL